MTDAELKALLDEQKKAMDAFVKTQNDKGQAEAARQEKLDKILADYDKAKDKADAEARERKEIADRLNQLEAAKNMPHSNGNATMDKDDAEYAKAFNGYMRRGKGEDELKDRSNAMSVGSDPDGGYMVPPAVSARVIETVATANPMRQLATIETISSDQLDINQDPDDMTASWVGETATRSETTNPKLFQANIPVHELYVMPKATQKLMDDAAVNIEQWLGMKAGRAFASAENTAFMTGVGVGKPKGITAYSTIANASWTVSSYWGYIGHIVSGSASALATTGADLADTVEALREEYRANAAWIMNSATKMVVRKLRAGTNAANQFLFWQPSYVAGQQDTLLGYPIYRSDAMPSEGSNTYPVAFGDFKAAYTIVDRIGVRVLRDPYSAKPYVSFYTTKRVGGAVVNFEAIKLVKCST